MCKGCAVLVNFREAIVCDGSSHSAEGINKDNYLALNVIYDDRKKCGYRIELDCHDDETRNLYMKKLFLLKGRPNPKLVRLARKEIRLNEAKVFRILCRSMQSAKISGQSNRESRMNVQDNISARIGMQDNSSARIGGQDNSSARIGEMYLYRMKLLRSREATRLIEEFSKSCDATHKATLSNFVEWLVRKR